MPRKKPKPDPFIQGYACAVATLQRMDGSGSDSLTTEVKDLMLNGGIQSEEKCRAAGVDPYDLEALFPVKKAGGRPCRKEP